MENRLFKITFLGGADEVGASCSLLEIGGRRLLVDCGIRMSARNGDVLPYLAPIEKAGGIDAIILTHAHTDHSGALPVIHQLYPRIPVYMTAATLTLTTILLMDSLKIMQMEFEREGEIPLYPAPAVELLISASRPVAVCTPLEIFGGDIRLTFTPAGHILGAATVLVESDDGVVLMGGDVSVTDQLTIPGMMLPPPIRPDLVVIESTYGGRHHASRSLEEQRLVSQAKTVLERGGGILFPAFAVGRSQEVILILSRAMERNDIPKAPIFVDGMVRTVCSAYRSYPELLTPWLRKRIEKKGDPFYPSDGTVEPVFKPNLREKYANTRPAIYVASSGMLTGGPSPYYATKLAPNPKNCIAITGYQDEESPGRRVQDVAREGGGTLRLHDEDVELKCEVGTYGLSAHSDTGQLVDSLKSIEPYQIALVHGDRGAREALETAIYGASLHSVHRPTIGSTLEVQSNKRRFKQVVQKIELPPQTMKTAEDFKDFQSETLFEIAKILLVRDGRGRNYTIPEIIFAWGLHGELYAGNIEHAATLLYAKGSPFKRDKKRGFLYRLRTDTQGNLCTTEKKKNRKEARKSNQQMILERIDELFPAETGVYRRGVKISGPDILLYFHFPQIQSQTSEVKAAIELFTKETGWGIKIHPQIHQAELISSLKEELPSSWKLKKNPAIHLDDSSVTIQLLPGHTSLGENLEFQENFTKRTGFQLKIKPAEIPIIVQKVTPKTLLEAKENESLEMVPIEINKAYELIRGQFQECPGILRKCGQKNDQNGPYIEMGFISPQLGRQFQEQIDMLQSQIGWKLQIKQASDQHQIKTIASNMIPEEWGLKKSPGFHENEGFLSIKVVNPPTDEILKELSEQIKKQTGFELRVHKSG
jgi:Cft2 family RNA processing exonuclease